MTADRETTYWTAGITLTPSGGQWSATSKFRDRRFAGPDSVEGELATRYLMPTAAEAIDVLIRELTALGIGLGTERIAPWIYIEGDGEDPGIAYPPGWPALLLEQARRIGWGTYNNWSPDQEGATS